MAQGLTKVRERARRLVYGCDGPRHYLPPDRALPDFFDVLDRHGVGYVVLRWFDTLPDVEPGEDIDLLVADEHLELVRSLLPGGPDRGGQAFDVYSVSGLPGSDFAGVPYFPPDFARAILATAVTRGERYRVPDPEHHFWSLAYHAAYHKGYASGLPTGRTPDARRRPSDHDYGRVLCDLATGLGREITPTLDDVDRLLADAGLRPPLDTLQRLLAKNPWIQDHFIANLPALDTKWQGLVVFVLRERAEPQADLVAAELDRHGFEILEVVRLDQAQRDAARQRIRGGNWERGPWPVSGGVPAVFVVAYDVAPWFEGAQEPRRRGVVTNARIAEAKAKLRGTLLQGLDARARYNPLHSSDSPRQALDYLEALGDPQLMARLQGTATDLLLRCRMPWPVIRPLAPDAPARRARVALVDHPVHGPAVCKIYRPGALRYFDREVRARKELEDQTVVPGLLDHGDNWLLTPFYRDDRRHVLRRLPFRGSLDRATQLRPEAVTELVRFARALHERGLFILDLSTGNLRSDPQAGLKVLDLEFLQEYVDPAPPLAGCYSFVGIPPSAAGHYDQPQDVPLTGGGVGNPVFHPAVSGLPVRRLLGRERAVDRIRRPATRLAWYWRLAVADGYRAGYARFVRSRWGQRAKRVYRHLQPRLKSRLGSGWQCGGRPI